MATKKKTTSTSRTTKPASKTAGKSARAPAKKAGARTAAAKKKVGGKAPKDGAKTIGTSRAKRGGKETKSRKASAEEILQDTRPAENPAAHALARKIAETVVDKKALDVLILDVRGMTSYADYFVVGSGESERQVTAMADAITDKVKKEDGLRPIGTEGTDTGQWVLLDYGEVVAHLFFNEVRAFYDLEGLWADAPREALH